MKFRILLIILASAFIREGNASGTCVETTSTKPIAPSTKICASTGKPVDPVTGKCPTRRALNSICEYRHHNGEIKQGKIMQTIDNKEICVIYLSDLKQVGEICQLGIYNGWNPLRNWQVSGTVSQDEKGLICSVLEIPAEPQLARPPLPTRATLLNLQ